MEKYLSRPTRPLKIKPRKISKLLEDMEFISFQGRALASALRIWKEMLKDDLTIFMGLSGAMVPAGLREVIAYLIENKFIDCLVSTGANLFHDCHESLGRFHYLGVPHLDDIKLKECGIDRIYDTLARETEFRKTDAWIIQKFLSTLDLSRPYTTREFFYLLGEKLSKVSKKEGILTSAYKSQVPVYCPAIADSSFGIAIAVHNKKLEKSFLFDVIAEVNETAEMVLNSKATGVIYIGGGVPKNFIQQAEVTASFYDDKDLGHKYAIQITTDAPHWGGLSGCTFQEAQSWGKIHQKARVITVYSDATIALPFLVTALGESAQDLIKKRKFPVFDWKGKFKIKR